MAKFRKKPVVIEAVTWYGKYSGPGEWPDWFNDALKGGAIEGIQGGTDSLVIATLEGTMYAQIGDVVIQGIKGELYPCKPDIFEATYEAVAE